MIFNLGKLLWRTRRRSISGVTLLAYLACAIGFPLPEASARPANACGETVCCCGTAVECRSSGCGCTPAPPVTPSCCAKKKPAAPASCCTTEPKKEAAAGTKPVAAKWVLGMSAQKCRGDGQSNWISAEVALPGPTPTVWQPGWPYCHSLPITHVQPFVLAGERLDPPPRLGAI